MNDILEFFRGLFDYDDWPPRWKCGTWSDFHGWVYIISELMVWTAYFLIPLLILNYFQKKGTSIRFRRVYLLFATFILLCGSTHFLDALMFWIPMYRFNALVRLATGIVSLFTVYHLFRVLPDLFKQKTSLELEKEIARRQEAERKLEEANRGLEAFAYMASHDLQEPARKISLFANRLYSANEQVLDEKSRDHARKIIQSATRMQSLIQDVLSLSTISSDITLTPVDTAAVVKAATDDLEVAIQDRGARIEWGDLPPVRGHAAYLTQLFYNLISNAIKFTDKPPVVRIEGRHSGNRVLIEVTDNGIGMEQEDLQRIFHAFERVHSKTAFAGTGIGLAICKKIVAVHGGNITVRSQPGAGTTFTIDLQSA